MGKPGPCTCQATGLPLQVGDVITVNAGGGGGDPALRERTLVQQDLALGYISAATAKAIYGVG